MTSIRPFILEITHNRQSIAFGPRYLGDIGRDIRAAKLALGAIIGSADIPDPSTPRTSDANGWFDCKTGVRISPVEASTFDVEFQKRLMKFQLDNQFFIICYLFQKFGVPRLISDSESMTESTKEMKAARRTESILKTYDIIKNIFQTELGTLGEATIAIMHDWAPHTVVANQSYYHNLPYYSPGSNEIPDIIPLPLFYSYVNGNFSQKPQSDASLEKISKPLSQPGPDETSVYINNSENYENFILVASDDNEWVPSPHPFLPTSRDNEGTIFYKRKIEPSPSILFAAARKVLEDLSLLTDPGANPQDAARDLERIFEPDPFSDPDPFIRNTHRIGFFDITPYTFDNLPPSDMSADSEVRRILEDAALTKVLGFYSKPEISFIRYDDPAFLGEYYEVPLPILESGDNFYPDHDLKMPEMFGSATIEYDSERSRYWVLSTRDNIQKFEYISESSVQFYDVLEGRNDEEPLIKFIEFRTPSLRPGDQYRAYYEINRRKLDLIKDGISPPQITLLDSSPEDVSTRLQDLINTTIEGCEDLSEEEIRTRHKEYKTFLAKNRREIARKLREQNIKIEEQYDINNSAILEPGILGDLGNFSGFSLNDEQYSNLAGDLAGSLVQLGYDAIPFGKYERSKNGATPSVAMTWTELKQRAKIMQDDLSEASKHAKEESVTFGQTKDFVPSRQSRDVEKLIESIEKMIKDGDEDFVFGTESSIPVLGSINSESEYGFGSSTTVTVLFHTNEKGVLSIASILTGNGKSIYTAVNGKAPIEFKKKYAVGYLSQIKDMTSGILGSIRHKVVNTNTSCDDEFGILKNGVSYLKKYTIGIEIKSRKKDQAEFNLHKWWDEKVSDPVGSWVDQTQKNITDSFDPSNFDETEVEKLLGKPCTLKGLYSELFNKINIPKLICDYLRCVKLPGFNIDFPDFNFAPMPKVPIFGYYVGMVKFIIEQFEEIIVRLLCTFARTIIDFLNFPFCQEQIRDQLFGEASSGSPVVQSALINSLIDLGLDKDKSDQGKKFVDDAFNLLTGREICSLLAGEPISQPAMSMLQRVAQSNDLGIDFSDRESITNFFGVIGLYTDEDLCESILNTDVIIGTSNCRDTTDYLSQIRRRMLENSDGVETEEIREALAMAEKNQLDLNSAFESLASQGINGMMPSYLDFGSEDAIINKLPDHLQESMELTVKSMFEGAKQNYVSSLSSFVPSMSVQRPIIARAGSENYNEISVIRVEAILEGFRNMNAATTPIDRLLALHRLYTKENYLEDGHLIHIKYNRIDEPVGYDESLLLDQDELSLKPTGYILGIGYEAMSSTVAGADILPGEQDDISINQAIASRITRLNQLLEVELPKATSVVNSSEHLAIIRDLFSSSLEDAREASSSPELIDVSSNPASVTSQTFKLELPDSVLYPSVSLKEYQSDKNKDSYTITLKDKFTFGQPDFRIRGQGPVIRGSDGELVFEYCDLVPRNYSENNQLPRSFGKREVFSQFYLERANSDMRRYDLETYDIPNTSRIRDLLHGHSDILSPGERFLGMYKKTFEGIYEQIFFEVSNSRMFDELYATEVDQRVKGRYYDGNCIKNKFNLNHYGILSFDKMVTEEIPSLVQQELAKPENQPQNLDYNDPGPIERAIQMAAMKGYIRVGLIELLLKGAMVYSVWDVEGVVSDDFFKDYVYCFIRSQIESSDLLDGHWKSAVQRIENLSSPYDALRKLVERELLLLPDLSKKVYENNSGDYSEWFFSILPNVDVSKKMIVDQETQKVSWEFPLKREDVPNDPFMHLEHYVRIDGDFANLENIRSTMEIDQTGLIESAIQLSIETNPETNKNLFATSENLEILPEIARIYEDPVTEIDGTLDLERIATILEDEYKTKELVSSSEVQEIFDVVNLVSINFDDFVSTRFGFISDFESPAHLMADAIRRTPARPIIRKRDYLTLSDSVGATYDLGSLVADLPSLKSMVSPLRSKTNRGQSSEDRFYLSPIDAEGLLKFNSNPTPDSLEKFLKNEYNVYSNDAPGSGESVYYSSDQELSVNVHRQSGYKIDSPFNTEYEWNKSLTHSETFDTLGEFQNRYGKVTEELYRFMTDQYELNSSAETWSETIIDFKGNNSIKYSLVGESYDPSVVGARALYLTNQVWEKTNIAMRRLEDYLGPDVVNRYRNTDINKDSPGFSYSSQFPATYTLGSVFGYQPKGDFRYRDAHENDDRVENVLFNKRTFSIGQDAQSVSAEPAAIMLKRNEYLIPVRLLITQVRDEQSSTTREVYSSVLIPEMLNFKSLDSVIPRGHLLDEAVEKIIQEYIEMVEETYEKLITAGLADRFEVTAQQKMEKCIDLIPEFPCFLRQTNAIYDETEFLRDKPSFFSVSKAYSVACNLEAERGSSVFCSDVASRDKQFNDPGLLMKSNNSRLSQSPSPSIAHLQAELMQTINEIKRLTYRLDNAEDGWVTALAEEWSDNIKEDRRDQINTNTRLQKQLREIDTMGIQQSFGLNYLYESSLYNFAEKLDSIDEGAFASLATSLSNIFQWHKQRRYESMWGQTNVEMLDLIGILNVLPDNISDIYTLPSPDVVRARTRAVQSNFDSGYTREDIAMTISDRILRLSAHSNLIHEDTNTTKEMLYTLHNIACAVHFPILGDSARVVLNPPEQILGSYCGFSPFASDGRFHIQELHEELTNSLNVNLELSAQEVAAATAATIELYDPGLATAAAYSPSTLMTWRSNIFNSLGYEASIVDNYNFLFDGNASERYKIISTVSDETNRVFADVGATIINARYGRAYKGIYRAGPDLYKTFEINHEQPVLARLSTVGFPGMSLGQKVNLILSDADHARIKSKLPIEASEIMMSINKANDYRETYGSENVDIITSRFPSIIDLADAVDLRWRQALVRTGLFYFYELMRDRAVNDSFSDLLGTISKGKTKFYQGIRLVHNSLESDAKDLSNIFKSDTRYDILTEEERSYLMKFKSPSLISTPENASTPSQNPTSTDDVELVETDQEMYDRLHNARFRDYGTIISQPMSSYEREIEFNLCFNFSNFQRKFDQSKSDMLASLISQEDTRLVVDYVFPVKRYMAMTTAFSTSALSAYGNMPNLLKAARASIAFILSISHMSPKEKLNMFSDIGQSEFYKQLSESRTSNGSAIDCFDFPGFGEMLSSFVEALEELIKQMPSIILRGIADIIDPAYKEMKYHWANCEIEQLSNRGIANTSYTSPELFSGLRPKGSDGKYVPLLIGVIGDSSHAAAQLSRGELADGFAEFGQMASKLLSYIYNGPPALLDPSFAFQIPCLDIDINYKDRWNLGLYGRYGHPATPLTYLALSTYELRGEKRLKEEKCRVPEDAEICEEE